MSPTPPVESTSTLSVLVSSDIVLSEVTLVTPKSTLYLIKISPFHVSKPLTNKDVVGVALFLCLTPFPRPFPTSTVDEYGVKVKRGQSLFPRRCLNEALGPCRDRGEGVKGVTGVPPSDRERILVRVHRGRTTTGSPLHLYKSP